MKLVVGLGNPGEKYTKTRHNVGFLAVKAISNQLSDISFSMEKKFDAEIAEKEINNEKVIFAMPQTFMNNSGDAVAKIAQFYKIKAGDIFVIYDDLDLPLGEIRTGKFNSAGGHNGIKSIIEQIGTTDFVRIRVGIGSNRERGIPAEDYVLQKFSEEEQEKIDQAIDKAGEIVINLIS